MRAVAKVFEVAEGCGQTTPMLRLDNIQTQAIDPYLLPRHVSSSFAKKADLALAFSPDHPAVAARLEPVQKSYPDLALSQMTDACTSTVPLVSCVKVKERGVTTMKRLHNSRSGARQGWNNCRSCGHRQGVVMAAYLKSRVRRWRKTCLHSWVGRL